MNDASFKEKLLKYVTDREGELIENVKEIVRQPSVSSTGEGVEACCDLIIRKMQSMGIEATKHPVKPFPIITGKVGDDPAKKTVLIYAHYDVQPEGDLALWETPPGNSGSCRSTSSSYLKDARRPAARGLQSLSRRIRTC